MMRMASVCSGIGGAEVAFQGIAAHAWASETEPFPRAVLAHRFPGLQVHGDFRDIPADAGPADVLVGGTPCQSFSVAGLRRGLADQRGNLVLEYLRLVDRLRPRWVLWENVPGVLSSNGGRDFGAFLGGLAECGYGWAYRVLDAQYFGLAQRRKRVFVVGCLGDWRRAAAVLFEPASLRGHPAPRREAREETAATLMHGVDSSGRGGYAGRRREDDYNIVNCLTERADCGGTNSEGQRLVAAPLGAKADGGWRGDLDNDSYVIADPITAHEQRTYTHEGTNFRLRNCVMAYGGNNTSGAIDLATAVRGHEGSGWHGDFDSETFVTHSLRADGFDASEDGTGRGTPLVAMAFHQNQRAEVTTNDTTGALNSGGGKPGQGYPAAQIGSLVRRLTPTECERLQGFPDGWTDIEWRGKRAADGPRYRALGNAFAVPVVRWIARRLAREHAATARVAA